jgi:hypothetical protein
MSDKPITTATSGLLEEIKNMEGRKLLAIKDLLVERTTLKNSTDKRLGEIAVELKALGHKRKINRKPRVKTA